MFELHLDSVAASFRQGYVGDNRCGPQPASLLQEGGLAGGNHVSRGRSIVADIWHGSHHLNRPVVAHYDGIREELTVFGELLLRKSEAGAKEFV